MSSFLNDVHQMYNRRSFEKLDPKPLLLLDLALRPYAQSKMGAPIIFDLKCQKVVVSRCANSSSKYNSFFFFFFKTRRHHRPPKKYRRRHFFPAWSIMFRHRFIKMTRRKMLTQLILLNMTSSKEQHIDSMP